LPAVEPPMRLWRLPQTDPLKCGDAKSSHRRHTDDTRVL
jgi:hypothetical protein